MLEKRLTRPAEGSKCKRLRDVSKGAFVDGSTHPDHHLNGKKKRAHPMTRTQLTAATLVALAAASMAHAQSATVYNPSFEIEGASNADADGWREFFPAKRREFGDGISPTPYFRTGTGSMEMPRGTAFDGFDTY